MFSDIDSSGNPRQVIGYYRVSDPKQVKNGVSLEAQREKIQKWADHREFAIVEWYHDDGITAKSTTDRHALFAAIEHVKRIKGVLATYTISRFARNALDALQMLAEIHKAGGDIAIMDLDIDTTNMYGKAVFTMISAVTELESAMKGQSIKLALQHIKNSEREGGGHIGKPPYGHRFDIRRRNSETGEEAFHGLAEVPEEQAIIRHIKELRSSGLVLRAIASQLELENILTRSGKIHWHSGMICSIIRENQ